MCYSKEVSLITGATILLSTVWIIYAQNVLRILDRKSKLLLYLLAGYAFIGLHQLFEFLSIYTGSDLVYRIGLLCSISAMVFNLKASEEWLGRSLRMEFVYFSLGLIAIHLFTRDMVFSNAHFYVRGESHFYWGALWMLYFLYWNFIHLQSFIQSSGPQRGLTLFMPFAALNISFILAMIYSYSFGFIKQHDPDNPLTVLCAGLLTDFEIVFDAPSIWCCFAALQGLFLYSFAKRLYATRIELPIASSQVSLGKAFIAALVLVTLIFITLPFFSALSYKMILK